MVKLKIRELHHDAALYPRLQIDQDHVQRLIDALDAGAELPPLVVWRVNRKISDGNHRLVAWERKYGLHAEIACIEKDYRDEAAFFLDAIELNGAHGLVMAPRDRQRAMEIASELKIDPKRYAAAMRMTVKAAGELSVRPIADTRITPSQRARPFVLNGKRVFNPGARRAQFVGRLDSVVKFLESGDLDAADVEVVSRLERIAELVARLVIVGRTPAKEVADSGPSFRELGGGVDVECVLDAAGAR